MSYNCTNIEINQTILHRKTIDTSCATFYNSYDIITYKRFPYTDISKIKDDDIYSEYEGIADPV